MRAKWSARRSDAARPAADPSTRSVELATPRAWARGVVRFDIPPLGGSSSGRTTDSDSVYLGSNPSPPAKLKRPAPRAGLFHCGLRLQLPAPYSVTIWAFMRRPSHAARRQVQVHPEAE